VLKRLLTAALFSILIQACDGSKNSPVTVLVSNNDIYIKTEYKKDGIDKIWRLKVGAQIDKNTNGVIDFLGERLADAKSRMLSISSQYHRSKDILRYGGDESAPLYLNSKIAGGNHKINSNTTVHNYSYSIKLDGKRIESDDMAHSGEILLIEEFYQVSLGDGEVLASVHNQYKFQEGVYCHFLSTVTALKNLEYLAYGGIQFQQINIPPKHFLILRVPNSAWSKGVDITDKSKEFLLLRNLWKSNIAPNKFVVEVVFGQKVVRQFEMVYESGVISQGLKFSFYRSPKGKMYPRAFELKNVKAGKSFSISGYFGFSPPISPIQE